MADNLIVNRPGQQDGTGDSDALFLKVFSGEVLTAFREKNRFLSRHMVRSISSGKSAQFPASWKASASYHTPGQELSGQTINMNERVITIDDLLVSDVFIPEIDEAKAHYEYRSEYSFQMGAALARSFDTNVAQVGVLASRGSATVSGGNGGASVTDADFQTNGASAVTSIFTAAQKLDEKDVPEEDRYVFVKPQTFYNLVQENDVIDADLVEGNNGGRDTGRIAKVAGIWIVKTNNLPQSNVTSGPSAYQGDFSNTVGLVMHRSAVGTVKLIDLATEMEYLIRNQGTFMVAKYAIGHGILRPESAIEVKSA